MNSAPTRAMSSRQRDYHCQPCGISMYTANIKSHLAGKNHRKRCAKLGATNNDDNTLAAVPSVGMQDPAGSISVSQSEIVGSAESEMSDGKRTEIFCEGSVGNRDGDIRVLQANSGSDEKHIETPQAVRPGEPDLTAQPPSPPPEPTLTTTIFAEHMDAKVHRRNMEIRSIQGKIASENVPPRDGSAPSAREYCSSCMEDFQVDEREKHYGSISHALDRGIDDKLLTAGTPTVRSDPFNLPPRKLGPVVAIDAFHCVLCGLTGKLVDFEEHMNSVPHRKQLRGLSPTAAVLTPQMTALHSRRKTWYCATCMIDFHVDSKEAHLVGNRHTRMPVRSTRRIRRVRTVSRDEASTLSSDKMTDLDDGSLTLPGLVKAVPASEYFNLPSVKLEPIIAIDPFHCVLCGLTCKLVNVGEHINSVPHREENSGLIPTEDGSTPWVTVLHSRGKTWYCPTCKIDFNVDSKEAHIAGNRVTRMSVDFTRRLGSVRSCSPDEASTVGSGGMKAEKK